MSPGLDTALIPAQDREEVIRQAVWDSVVVVDIDHHPPAGEIRARMDVDSVGPLRVCSARSTEVTLRRTERLVRKDEEPSLFLSLQVTGTSMGAQNGRECVVRPGEFAVFRSNAPYTLLFDEGVDHHFLRLPLTALALPDRLLRDTTTVTFSTENPLARLAYTYFSQLAVSDEIRRSPHADAVVAPSIELLRAVLISQHGDMDTGLAKEPMEATLALRIRHYVREHLAEPDLSAARIAAAHDISVRHLYAVLSRAGISLGDWIRARRLDGCKRELAGPAGRSRTVAAIGRSWGFVNATHFSRVFKDAYGMSPRTWRDLNHR
ncbi:MULTISPECIES: helix-turn-helix domain-containing protein [unclassified Streptomyces]|uniref:AraC-like ligand-binding domain-containing protein n=1 Tax=unclassified Streptomyces TaxID=2593676 RepID=UPI0003674ED3|nr:MULTISPECIES: helix-turn-helix domain-containing protein [unclassified Streptomyces]MYY02415.1 helix-turn-helix domain-containing protein [Streptomyces sp. SID4913]